MTPGAGCGMANLARIDHHVQSAFVVLPLSGLTGLPAGWRANVIGGTVGPEDERSADLDGLIAGFGGGH